jgi:hypothetical protein
MSGAGTVGNTSGGNVNLANGVGVFSAGAVTKTIGVFVGSRVGVPPGDVPKTWGLGVMVGVMVAVGVIVVPVGVAVGVAVQVGEGVWVAVGMVTPGTSHMVGTQAPESLIWMLLRK